MKPKSFLWSAVALAVVFFGVSTAAQTTHAAAPKARAIAVLYLDYAGQDEELAALRKGLTQMLITDLSQNPALTLVERVQLESVMAELELGTTRAIDPTTAAKVGKLLGARYLVLGGYFVFAGSLRVDVRVVDVETGKTLKGLGVTGKGDDFMALEEALVAGLNPFLEAVSTAAVTETPRKPVVATSPAVPDNPIVVEPGIQKKPQAPPRLRTKTAARYGKALDLMDKGKTTEAKDELQKVVQEAPEFGLANNDLQRLVQ